MVTPEAATLYINADKLTSYVKAHLGDAVEIRPYDSIFSDIEALSQKSAANGDETGSLAQKYLISNKASWALVQSLGGDKKVDEVRSPIADAKAVKNKIELEGMRACHVRDGAALIEYFAWLEDQLIAKGAKIDEVEAADKLEAIRS